LGPLALRRSTTGVGTKASASAPPALVAGVVSSFAIDCLHLEWFRTLCRMRVLTSRIDTQLRPHLTAQRILRQHPLHRQLDHPLGMLLQHPPEGDELLAAHVPRVTEIRLLVGLPTAQLDLL